MKLAMKPGMAPAVQCAIWAASVTIDEATRSSAGVLSGIVPLTLGPKDEVDIEIRVGEQDEGRTRVAALSHTVYDVLRGLAPEARVAAWLVEPRVMAKYIAQAWVKDHAVPIDDGTVKFDALPLLLQACPTVGAFRRQESSGDWDVLADAVPAHAFHTGPYEVYLDATQVGALAAIYSGDADVLEQVLGGGADALDGLTDRHWDALRAAVQTLSPTAASHELEFVLPLHLSVRTAMGAAVDPEDARRALLAIARDRQKFAALWASAEVQAPAPDLTNTHTMDRRYPGQQGG